MEPLAIVAFTGGIVGQIGFMILRFRPVCNFVRRLIDCLRHPRPPPPQAVTADRIFDAIEEHENDQEVNDNPIEAVRQTVPITDDPTLPVLTFRTWIIGPITCAFLAFITQFLGFRQKPVYIDSSCFTILTLVIGRLLASILPAKTIRIPIVNWSFSTNPGPFNIKEHVVLNILAGSGQSSVFTLVIVTIAKAFYHKNISFWASFILIQTTQMVGYGFAGIFVKFLVNSPHMWWPFTLLYVSFFRLLHEPEKPRAKRTLRGRQFVMIVAVSSFAYHIIPNYFFPSISTISLVCLIWKKSILAQQIGSGLHGLGIGSFSLDWNVITGFLANPLVIPMFSVINTMVGFILVAYIIVPISYWANVYNARQFPVFSSNLFDVHGQKYNVSRVVNEDLTLNKQAYDNYSIIYMSIYLIFSFGFRFASETASITYFILYHGKESWVIFKKALKGKDQFNDVHNRLMNKSYKPIPQWWFLMITIPMIVLAIINSIYFGTDFQIPYWGVLLGYLFPFILTLPTGVISATTGQGGIDLYGLSQLIMGSLYPGYPIANLAFKSYCFSTLSTTMTIIPELKVGHYMKIPPRSLFFAQVVGSFIAYSTSLCTVWWLLDSVKNICDPDKLPMGSPWTCPSEHRIFSSTMVWGGVGPAHVFAPYGQYRNIYYFFLVGIFSTLLAWLLGRMFPKKKWIRLINVPVILSAVQSSPPTAAIHFWSWFSVAVLFNWILYRKNKGWIKYKYDLCNGVSLGAAAVALLTSFTLGMGGIYGLSWWGLDYDDHCPLALCPTAHGVTVDGCPIVR